MPENSNLPVGYRGHFADGQREILQHLRDGGSITTETDGLPVGCMTLGCGGRVYGIVLLHGLEHRGHVDENFQLTPKGEKAIGNCSKRKGFVTNRR